MRAHCSGRGVNAVEADVFVRGGECAVNLAEAVVAPASQPSCPRPLYAPDQSLEAKIETVARRIYGATEVHFEAGSRKKLRHYAVLSDDPKLIGAPSGFTMTVADVHLSAGAGFVVVIAGNMLRMPGLGKDPQAVHMDVNEDGEIVGLG